MAGSSQAPKSYQRAHRWIETLSPEGTNERSIAAQLASETLRVFKAIVKHGAIDDKGSAVAKRRVYQVYSYFSLWVDGYGIEDGFLDTSISRSRSLRRAITEMLVSISNTLTTREYSPYASDAILMCKNLHNIRGWFPGTLLTSSRAHRSF